MKKIFLLMFLSCVYLFADASTTKQYEFYVDNATMIDAYFNIFNAMAGMFNSVAYNNLLKLVFLMGGFIVFFMGVLKTYETTSGQLSVSEFTKYMLVGTALLTLIHSKDSSLVLKTNKIPTFCAAGTEFASKITSATTEELATTTGVVVSNIPEVLGWGFAFINEIGTESTRLAKTAFGSVHTDVITQSPADFASYLSSVGSIMSLKLSDITSNTRYSTDTTLEQSLQTVMNDCILIPATADSLYGDAIRKTMFSTGDMIRTIDMLINNATLVRYKNPTQLDADVDSGDISAAVTMNGVHPGNLLVNYNASLAYCSTAWADVSERLNVLKNSGAIECGATLRNVLNEKTMRIYTGSSAIDSSKAKEIAINAGVTNVLFNSTNNIMASEMAFASGKSMAQFVNESMGTGYYMAQMLPYLQMGMRAILYAFFPFVFVVVLLPGGIKILISYLQSLVWIELWSPTAAILDMFMELVAGTKFQDMYNNQGSNMLNGIQTFSDTAMLASVAGYLYASVPALTWLILKGSGYMLGNISGAVASRLASNLNSDSINKDVADITKRDMVNSMRRNVGKEAVSLAEIDRSSANLEGRTAGGQYIGKSNLESKIATAAVGSLTASTAAGQGVYNAMGNNDSNAFEDLTKQEQLSAATKIKTGERLTNDDISRLSNADANKVLTSLNVSEKEQNQIKNHYELKSDKELIQKVSEITSGENFKSNVALNTSQENLAKALGMSKEKAMAAVGELSGNKEVMEKLSDKKYLTDMGVIDKKTGAVDTNRLKEVANVVGTEKAIATRVQENVQNNSSTKEQIQAKANNILNTIGQGLARPEMLDLQMKALVAEGVPGAKQMVDSMKGKSAEEKIKAYSTFTSLIGAEGGMAEKAASDATARQLYAAGFTSSQLAQFAATSKIGDIGKVLESSKFMEMYKNETVKDENGKEVPTELAKTLKGAEEQFNKETNNAYAYNPKATVEQNRINTSFRNMGVAKILESNSGVMSNLSNNAKAEKIMNDYNIKPDQMGKIEAFTVAAQYYKNNLLQSMTGDNPDIKGKLDGGAEMIRTLRTYGSVIQPILNKINPGKYDKKGLEKLEADLYSKDAGTRDGALRDIVAVYKNF